GLAYMNFFLPVLISVFSVISVFVIFLAVIKLFKFKNKFFAYVWKLKYIFFICFAIAFSGFLVFNLSVTIYNNKEIAEKKYEFTGAVFAVHKDEKEGYLSVVLENVKVLGEFNETISLSDKTLITLSLCLDEYEEEYVDLKLKAGHIIEGKASFKNIELVKGFSVNTYGVRNGFRYFAYCDEYEISEGSANFISGIRQYAADLLEENLSEEAYSTAYALIFGDKSLIKSDTMESFSLTGMAHILAVSGLHVGILMSVLFFVFKKLRIGYKYQFTISFLVLLFYAMLCSFSPSVLRAALMCLIYLMSKLLKRPYDSLSSLTFAALIILLFSPLYLFDAGFQMSFFAVLGIILLAPQFKRLFRFLPNFLNNLISISLAAQIGVLPLINLYFGFIPVLSIFFNILIIPLITVIYIFLIILLIIPIPFMFILPQIMLDAVLFVVRHGAMLSFSNVKFIFNNGFIFYYSIILLVSAFIFLKPKFKAIACSCLGVILVAVLILSNLTNRYPSYTVCYYDFTYDIYSISDNENFYLVSGGNNSDDYKDVSKMLSSKKITNIEGIIIFQEDENYMTLIAEVLTCANVENVYIRQSFIADDIIYMQEMEGMGINVYILEYKQPLKLQNISLTLYGDLGTRNAVYIDLYKFSALFIGNTNKATMEFLGRYVFLSPQIIIANNYEYEFITFYEPQVLLCKYQPNLENDKIFAVRAYGELIFSVNNDILIKK
ncbi:MAG: ComEC/Rec2 family competence protein, partial [Firmicutes bacterium]|nr:ComEC/Rec2 family competence protein [Bacillota bacterium]